MLTGHCLCGRIRYEITGEVGPVELCHCTHCRRSTGSAFSANGTVRSKDFDLVEGKQYLREHESRPGKFRGFCLCCGSPIYSRLDARPRHLRLRLGTLEDDPGTRPRAHIWVRSRAPWYEIRDGLPEHQKDIPRD